MESNKPLKVGAGKDGEPLECGQELSSEGNVVREMSSSNSFEVGNKLYS